MKTSTVALTVIAVIFIITTGVYASMYYSSMSAYSAEITAKNSEISTLTSQVSSDNSKISSLSSELAGYMQQGALATAMSHWNNIAIENTSLIIQNYAPNAALKWVGGPLSGTYSGTSQISSVWNKFTNLYETVYWYTIVPPQVMQINSSYYMVSAPVQFFVAPTSNPENIFVLNVTEILGLTASTSAPTGFLIQNEVWKVKPLPLTDVIAGYPGQNVLINDELLANAYAHWNNIAIENTSLIMQEYAPNAQLVWLGGPLNGTYNGVTAINATWTKFVNFYEYVVWYAEEPPALSVSGTSATVSAQLQFIVFPFPTSSNPTPHAILLNVNDTLTYQFSSGSWMLVHETWKVAPAPISSAAPGYSTPVYS